MLFYQATAACVHAVPVDALKLQFIFAKLRQHLANINQDVEMRLAGQLRNLAAGHGDWVDREARQASAFRPGKESAKPVRASLGATDQSAAVAQEHQPCELFPIARA